MPKQIKEEKRISKSYGRTMILIGVIFDLVPIFLIFAAVGLVVYILGDSIVQDVVDATSGNFIVSNWNKFQVAYKAGTLGAGIMAIIFFVGPIVYSIGSFFMSIIAYSFFSLWFLFRGVNIWSFGNSKRIFTTASSIFVEFIPVVNLLPGITFMVWRHIKIAQMEDASKNQALLQKNAHLSRAVR